MDNRAAKLALARKKLKDHQEKKLCGQGDDLKSDINLYSENLAPEPSPKIDVDDQYFKTQDAIESSDAPSVDINVTEILISNKRNLESQVIILQEKLDQLETNHALIIKNYKLCTDKVTSLENELHNINNKYDRATNEIIMKDSKINELNATKLTLTEEKCNLIEQLEFTKTVLNAKEVENDSLHSQLYHLQNQFDVVQLQLQQLTNGSPTSPQAGEKACSEHNEPRLHKIATLEQQLSLLQKERDQINLHYEHYVAELNEQLRSVIKKNEELTTEVQSLSNRENSLIEQISDMEIRIQNYNLFKKEAEVKQNSHLNVKDLQDDFQKVQNDLSELRAKHEELQKQYAESIAQIKELNEVKLPECNHDNISLSKLNADMASDKVAAQRATEQNKKLKQDLQGLEDAFVKMSKDKLELTEKITAEKYLNRELTIKLAEIDEKAKDMQSKLKAKDDEMIRLQANYRIIEKECEQLKQLGNECNVNVQGTNKKIEDNENIIEPDNTSHNEHTHFEEKVSLRIQKEDAMLKLQDRFLKIMGEVADLSDEKHRLEHIILQLQNETDTICEYVALYQQQRSLLKRRDEERTAQLKLFQQECGKLKCQLEELSIILTRFAGDKQLSSYFQIESKHKDIQQVMHLLSDLRNNSLIDPVKISVDFKNFYPCNCCSGKLLDV